ncbi:MAG TPA: Gfo/Idh/MocA family oxidoreductase, partial [Methylomirabilota bacterium]|nr:Gfo/Idh/MocA family oxidoreductase [Methylomirabilota bacterium]
APVRSEPGAYQRYYAGVLASLRHGAPPPVDPDDAVAGLEVIAAAQRSAVTHETVALPAASDVA